jgi:DNA-binding MarR family transcriptional regulator
MAKKTAAVDTSFLESLLGYNCRRASLALVGQFLDAMSVYGLRPVEFSVLSLVESNPGITSRQICATLGILSPNLVRIISSLDERSLLARKPHDTDKRAIGLHLTSLGRTTMRNAKTTAASVDKASEKRLSRAEREQLIALLQKIYQPKKDGSDCAE